MRPFHAKGYSLALGLVILAALALGQMRGNPSGNGIPQLPRTMLWAWERPEDLRFLDAKETGVAFLAGTLFLRGEGVAVAPRMQPLRLAAGTALVAVVRIEPEAPSLSAEQGRQAVDAILRLTAARGVVAVQVDYDAPTSQREFYAALLRELRQELPAGMPLSITALASWCLGDNWLDGLPVDEAVPMLFQMGVDNVAVRHHLMQGRDFQAALCRSSLGLATNEPVKNLPRGRRVYWFHARAWTELAARAAIGGTQP